MESAIRGSVPDGTRLIETFGWRPQEGFRHLDRHFVRMERSANTLGFAFDRASASGLLKVEGGTPHRCRLTLGADGFEFTAVPMTEVTGEWSVAVSAKRLQSDDHWLRHKTTQRGLYDQERASLPEGVDEWLFVNELDELCEGTITNLFVEQQDGAILTPCVSCGVLPGILREILLEQGRASEARVTLADLKAARAVYVGNSLRGLIRCNVVTG